MKHVIYTAAHGGFSLQRVPLGGGGAVCEHLMEVWRRTKPFPVEMITPSILGPKAPQGRDLVEMSETAYAQFCQAFEQASTQTILKRDPFQTVILCNDVSEGPNFRLLAERGYPIYTIYHVDVVDYVANIYLRGLLRPESTTHFYRWIDRSPLRSLIPSILKLVFEKQQQTATYSKGLIVPSQEMRNIILRCYPIDPGKVHVLPWGIWEEPVGSSSVDNEVARLRVAHQIPVNARLLLTLSRISPEKGQDRVLNALAHWEKKADYPAEGVYLFIAGEAAYMQGRRFRKKLETLCRKLTRTRVIFSGYASGVAKQALFRLADLYVFASRHESYGLTMLEAMREGVPVLATYSHGARDVLQPGAGELLPPMREKDVPELLSSAMSRLLADRPRLKAMGEKARQHASAQRFSDAAARLAQILSEHAI